MQDNLKEEKITEFFEELKITLSFIEDIYFDIRKLKNKKVDCVNIEFIFWNELKTKTGLFETKEIDIKLLKELFIETSKKRLNSKIHDFKQILNKIEKENI